MTISKRRSSNPNKSDRLALRINAKDKFALELLAQKKGTTISALIMESVRIPLKEGLTVAKKGHGHERDQTMYIPDEVYDPLLPDRIVKLALTAPEFLTDYEQVIWKVIQENPVYMEKNTPQFKKIRDRWDAIKTTADGLLKCHSVKS